LATARRLLRVSLAFAAFFVFPELRLGPHRHLPRHVRLRLFLQRLGGAWIKVGQALALRFDLLPRPYCSELLKLLSRNPPLDYADIRQVIQEDFGEPPETLFATFEVSPLATASIAQVHAATTKDGLQLAVKVQRPDAPRLFEADFRVVRLVANLIGIFDAYGGVALKRFFAEFERYTREELDFVNEARSGHRLWLISRHDPLQVCPRMQFELCSKRVLTMELLEGEPLLSFLDNTDELPRDVSASRPERIDAITHNFFWCMCNQIFYDGFFHADPHPANIFVLSGNRIGFVDFGAIGRLSSSLRTTLIRHFIYLYRNELEHAVREILRILVPTQDTDLSAVRRDLVLAFEQYRYGGSQQNANRRELTRELFINTMSISRRHGVLVPETMALYYKSTLMLDSILVELSPRYDVLADLYNFFVKAIAQEHRQPRRGPRRATLVDASGQMARLLRDIKTIATPIQLMDATLQTTQTRTMMYGVCSIAFCVGAFLTHHDNTGLFERATGLDRAWLVYSLLAIAGIILLRMQRWLRKTTKQSQRSLADWGAASS
jgi:predicted unusual protein kinase regulating ubiquinone biosynthesis (AarF/ABC1/UbiB family)